MENKEELKKQLDEGYGAGLWFIIITILFFVIVACAVVKCVFKPTEEVKKTKKTAIVYQIKEQTEVDSVINEMKLGETIFFVVDEKESITIQLNEANDKVMLEKYENLMLYYHNWDEKIEYIPKNNAEDNNKMFADDYIYCLEY